MRINPRSLRFNVILVIVAVVFSPLMFILISAFYDVVATSDIIKDVAEAGRKVKSTLEHIEPERWHGADVVARLDEFAAKHAVWLRLLDRQGNVSIETDHHLGEGLAYFWRTLVSWAFEPDKVPSLKDFDQSLGSLKERPEFQEALRDGEASGCRYSEDRKLKVCHHLLIAGNLGGTNADRDPSPFSVIYAQARTQRTIRALYDYRFQFLKLMFYNLALGLALAWWMSRYMVRPIEHLRRQVLERADFMLPGAGLEPFRKDEIGTLTEAFNLLLARLKSRTKANEDFLSDLAHEFKNPVAAVRACAENLEATETLEKTKKEKIVKILADSSRRLDALVVEFLELARAEAGFQGEDRERMDIHLLIANVVDILQQDPRYQDRRIEFHGVEKPLYVHGVTRRLEMAFRNLIDNGASFAGTNGLVRVEIRREFDQATISVKDNGPGITPDHLPRVFDRFFTTRGEDKGTGLGLAITRAIIEAHGGRIRAESGVESGAVFIVQLPIAEEG